jgi:DNA-binding LytR/AlgR family response regulator
MQLPDTLKVLIVDSDLTYLQLLSQLLRTLGVEQLATATDSATGLEVFNRFHPDLCIADIYLGSEAARGVTMADLMRSSQPAQPLILLSEPYSPACYEHCRHLMPVSFISKELSKFKIYQAIDQALLQQPPKSPAEQKGMHNGRFSLGNLRRVFFKVGDSYKPCPVEEVSFFFAANKLTHARVGQRSYPVNVQLKVLEDTFTNSFVRIHRTYLVNIAHIEAVNPREGTIHVAGETLPIGYAYRRDFMEGLRLMR